jgi:2-iminobutanoate/2-iminopropanoate deaminase
MQRPWPFVIVVAIVCVAAGWYTGASAQSGRRYIDPSTPSPTARPFSGGVLVGDTFYLSGTLGLGPNQSVPESADAEATNVLNNVRTSLEQAGMTMDDLVSVQIFCSDVAHYDAFNKVYRTYFKQEFPARAFIGSGKLLFGARFEIQAIAVKRR